MPRCSAKLLTNDKIVLMYLVKSHEIESKGGLLSESDCKVETFPCGMILFNVGNSDQHHHIEVVLIIIILITRPGSAILSFPLGVVLLACVVEWVGTLLVMRMIVRSNFAMGLLCP